MFRTVADLVISTYCYEVEKEKGEEWTLVSR